MKSKFDISKAVIKRDGKYLLLKRAAHSKSYPATWDFPGGKDTPGEMPKESVVRETKEETSFDIDPGEEIKDASYEDDTYELIFHYFIPQSVAGILKLSSDHSEYAWVAREDVKALDLHPSVTTFFQEP